MRKRLARVLITACFALCFATLAFAGSSTLSFSGGSGSILIITTAPGVTIDNFGVSGGGTFSAIQELRTSSPNSGYLGQSVVTGSSVEFQLSAQGSGSGNLEILADTEHQLDFQFNLIYDASTMDAIASAIPFHLNWITQFDSSAQIGGIAWSD